MEITGEQLIAANKIYNYLNNITDLDLTLKNNWTDISSDMIEFLQSPKLITYLKTNTDVRGILNQSDYKCIKGEILKDSKFITNCVVKFNINDEIFSPEEKQGALDFFFGKNE